MVKSVLLTLYCGFAWILVDSQTNIDPSPDRSLSVKNNRHMNKIVEEKSKLLITKMDNSSSNIRFENVIDNLTFKYMLPSWKNKTINEILTKLLGKCQKLLNNNHINRYGDLSVLNYKDVFNFEVLHDVFDVNQGLISGLTYKVRLKTVSSIIVKQVIIQTVLENGISIGNFIKYNLSNPKHCESTKQMEILKDDDSDCSYNIWTGDFQKKTASVTSWIFNQLYDYANGIEFRIYVRLLSTTNNLEEAIFLKKIILMKQKKDCILWLKNPTGIVDHTFLPLHSTDCKINFPSYRMASFFPSPIFVIKLMKLNIPCDNGSYIQFKDKQKVCGKLEELNENELTYHLSIHEIINIRTLKNVMFNFQYNLADYCYNKSVTEMNSTFFVHPTINSFECYIKIHLPYGNKINLTITTNFANSGLITDIDNIKIEHTIRKRYVGKPNFTKNLGKAKMTNSSLCDGIFIQIFENNFIQWNNCVQEINKTKKYSYISNSNVVLIYANKNSVFQKYGDISNMKILPSVLFTYKFQSMPEIVANCPFGWISNQKFCVTSVETAMSWVDGENYCSSFGGHLASIHTGRNQKLINKMIEMSPRYKKYSAYWIGGSYIRLEGDYKWSDGLSFQYSNWFPGWSKHNNYSKQLNDDGLSNQGCIELRKHFAIAAGIDNKTSIPALESFVWNERDCNAQNYIVCESKILDSNLQTSWLDHCNQTVVLNISYPKATVLSPSFPSRYPDNANCNTLIIAPTGFNIVVEFEKLVIESEPGCNYDFLEITEPAQFHENQQNNNKDVPKLRRHLQKGSKYRNRNSYKTFIANNNNKFENHDTNNLSLLNIFSVLYKTWLNNSSHISNYSEGNILYKTNMSKDVFPKKICGDWSSKLKLLRYVSRSSTLGLQFVSDYVNNFGGYKANVIMESRETECSDDRLKSFNGSCYLFISYPEVDWWTAQQICKEMGAQLASVWTPVEHRFIVTSITNQHNYMPHVLYWLGSQFIHTGEFEWTDSTEMTFQGWFSEDNKYGVSYTDSTCLGLQWKNSQTPMLPSGLYWQSAKCRQHGGYICKRRQSQYKYIELRNETVSGTEGRLTSPGYPDVYPANTDFWIHIVAASHSRIIVQFQKIDLEAQDECLYDFISIQNYDQVSNMLLEPDIVHLTVLKSKVDMKSIKLSSRFKNFARPKKNILKKFSMLKRFSRVKSRRKRSNKRRIIKKRSKRDIISQNERSFLPYVRWCGQHDSNLSKFDFVSISNEITINFHTDYSISGLGFAAVWKTVDLSNCPKQILTSREGIVSSPNYPHFLINNIDCSYVIQAPNGERLWLEFIDFDILEESVVYIDIGNGAFQPYVKKTHINDGIFISLKEQIKVQIKTTQKPRGRGFQAIYKTVDTKILERVIQLSNVSNGYLYHLNYPEREPQNIIFKQYLIAPLGDIIILEIYDVEFSARDCADNSKIEVFDYYGDKNGAKWVLCKRISNQNNLTDKTNTQNHLDQSSGPVHITSYMNTIHIFQLPSDNYFLNFNATIQIQKDMNFKYKLTSGDEIIESCQPNPCLHHGKCKTNGNKIRCQCYSYYTGRFCALNFCELEPCVFGKCELTPNNFKCHCQPGYIGLTCNEKRNPCADNPCEGRGECLVKNGGFICRCHAWWEGRKCENRMINIPQKPLSEKMLQEPFWLGLITVFVVLAIIGFFWCAKRHFQEKIEKLLETEADKIQLRQSYGHHHTSLREQLQFTSSIPQTTAINFNAPSRSILNRLGIRKPPLLIHTNPNTYSGATARTISLDDLLQPLTRRSTPLKKKRNNSTPTKKSSADKQTILKHLITPIIPSSPTNLNIDQLIQMTENNIKAADIQIFRNDQQEILSPPTPRIVSDSKLEKKVTFARLLNKVSAEMVSGSEMDICSDIKTSTDTIIFPSKSENLLANTNDKYLANNISSNLGSKPLSDLDITMLFDSNIKKKARISNADSILDIFSNFASRTDGELSPAESNVLSSSKTTSNPGSPENYVPRNKYLLSSFLQNSIVSTNGDATTSTNNLLHTPSVLLEIPNEINKCLSPIREIPTPISSPALTPIMSRLQKSITLEEYSNSSKNYKRLEVNTLKNIVTGEYEELIHSDPNYKSSLPNMATEIDLLDSGNILRPSNLVIPTLLLEQPSPNKSDMPTILFLGSQTSQPPVIIDENSSLFPKIQYQNSLDSPASNQSNSNNPLLYIELEECGATELSLHVTSPTKLHNILQSPILSKEYNNNEIQLNSSINKIGTHSDSDILTNGPQQESNEKKNTNTNVSETNKFEIEAAGDIVLSGQIISTAEECNIKTQLKLPLTSIQNEDRRKIATSVSILNESMSNKRTGMYEFSTHFPPKNIPQPLLNKSCSLNDFSFSNDQTVLRESSQHCHSYQLGNMLPSKNPNPRFVVACSSSCSENLNCGQDMMIPSNKKLQLLNRENCVQYLAFDNGDFAIKQEYSNNIFSDVCGQKQLQTKSRLKAICNQIRFLSRLEKSVKSRERQTLK